MKFLFLFMAEAGTKVKSRYIIFWVAECLERVSSSLFPIILRALPIPTTVWLLPFLKLFCGYVRTFNNMGEIQTEFTYPDIQQEGILPHSFQYAIVILIPSELPVRSKVQY